MEFKVMAGDRGRKAFAARLADELPEEARVSPPQPASPSRLVPGPRPVPAFPPAPPPVPVPATPAAPPSSPAAPHGQGKDQAPDDEQLCDVLSSAEFGQELTELLLSSVPSLTGDQVLQVRRIALESARKHGWVDM
jgi:hypothetical protein